MRLFKFTTGNMPTEAGEGVEWPDTMALHRKLVGGVWTDEVSMTVADIKERYGRNEGYKFEYINLPGLTGVTPYPLDPDGGDYEITGVNFSGWTIDKVTLVKGETTVEATEVAVTSDRRINFTTDALEAGTYRLTVTWKDYDGPTFLDVVVQGEADQVKATRTKK